MAPLGHFAKKIVFHRRRARQFHRVARRRHLRAARLARRALVAQRNGHPIRARRLLKRALRLKAQAARAALRAKFHRNRIAAVRRARRLHAQQHAGRV
jgi:hypothetical protein